MEQEDIIKLYESIGRNIMIYRKTLKMNQDELADLLGMSRSSIANIERGKQKTPLHVYLKIANQLNINLYKLISPGFINTVSFYNDAKKQIDELNEAKGGIEGDKEKVFDFISKT